MIPLYSVFFIYFKICATAAKYPKSELLQYLFTIDNGNRISGHVIVITYVKAFTAEEY